MIEKNRKGGIGEEMFDNFSKNSGRFDEGHEAGMHSENLYDQDEDGAGEKSRLDTGEKIDNSTYTGMEALEEREYDGSRDALGEINDGTEDDEAAKWLRQFSG